MHIADRVSANHNIAPQWDISDTLKVDLHAGNTYSLNLNDTCSDAVGDVFEFTLLSGTPASDTIVNNVYSFTSSINDTGKVVKRIVAKDHGNLSDTLIIKFTLKLQAESDTTHPVVNIKNIVNDSLIVSSSLTTIELNCTAINGIKKVEGFVGTISCLVTNVNDSTYSIAVKDLVPNQKNKVTIIVTDSSTPSIATTKEIYLRYDPTMEDNVPPVVNLKSPLINGERVFKDSITVQIACKDDNGIATVTCKRAGQAVAVVNSADSLYSTKITGLTAGKADTVTFVATDNSSKSNSDSMMIILNFNLPLTTEITSKAPLDGEYEIDTLPMFSWTTIEDPDGDDVYYKVLYGESSISLTSKTGEISGNSVKLIMNQKLQSNSKYYWQLIGYTKTPYADTTKSVIQSFTTFNKKPSVNLSVSGPNADRKRVDPNSGFITFSGTDPENGPLKFIVIAGSNRSTLYSSSIRSAEINLATYPLANFQNGTFEYGHKYYWCVVAIDNPNQKNSKNDTTAIDSFYTINRAPVWISGINPIKDTNSYLTRIDLSKICSDLDGNKLNYIVTGQNARVNGDTLLFLADSQLVTIRAFDNFEAQPCTTAILSLRRNFKNPLMKLIYAKNMTFQMGQIFSSDDSSHFVSFTYDYFMDSVEVSQEDFLSLMAVNNPSSFTGNMKLPVENVKFEDALRYCNARSMRDGLNAVYDTLTWYTNFSKNGYRLPTEAEWEYACHGGNSSLYFWGNNSADNYSWYSSNSNSTTNIVGTKLPNSFGLYDMSGNVREWCNDWYAPYSNLTQIDPTGPNNGLYRIIRGGGLNSNIEDLACSKRISNGDPRYRFGFFYVGFRVVRNK